MASSTKSTKSHTSTKSSNGLITIPSAIEFRVSRNQTVIDIEKDFLECPEFQPQYRDLVRRLAETIHHISSEISQLSDQQYTLFNDETNLKKDSIFLQYSNLMEGTPTTEQRLQYEEFDQKYRGYILNALQQFCDGVKNLNNSSFCKQYQKERYAIIYNRCGTPNRKKLK